MMTPKVTISVPGFDEEEGLWQDVESCFYETELLNEQYGWGDDGKHFVVHRCDALAVGFVYALTRGAWGEAHKQRAFHVMGMKNLGENAIMLHVTSEPLTPFGPYWQLAYVTVE